MLASCIFRYHNQSRLMLKCFKCGSGKLLPALSHVTSNFSSFNKVQNNGKFLLCKRSYSDEKSPSEIPQLMNFPMIIWPSIFKSIRNFILTTFIIRPYMDVDFDIAEFIKGSKRAVQIVSSKLSQGDIKSLNGLVTNDVLPNLHKAISLMSLSDREQIAINSEDIYFSFPYQVGIIFNDDDPDQKRFVEITMVYHSMKGLSAMRLKGEEPPMGVGVIPEYHSRMSVCNYRFVREYTKGVSSDWTINLLNHFRPKSD